jgi:hypothetical protein
VRCLPVPQTRTQLAHGTMLLKRRKESSRVPFEQKHRKEHSMSAGKKEPRTGTFLGVPYDWRRHGFKARLRERWWNPNEPRLFTPRAFGWGYAINLARLFRRVFPNDL